MTHMFWLSLSTNQPRALPALWHSLPFRPVVDLFYLIIAVIVSHCHLTAWWVEQGGDLDDLRAWWDDRPWRPGRAGDGDAEIESTSSEDGSDKEEVARASRAGMTMSDVKSIHQPGMPLDSLPAELRRQILSHLDLNALKALVFASPIYHQQYLLERKRLLIVCLNNTMGRCTADARAEQHYALIAPPKTNDHVNCTCFYRQRLHNPNYSIQKEKLLIGEVIDMTQVYYGKIEPVAKMFAEYALANLQKYSRNKEQHEQALSKTELTRIRRAVYRYQIICAVFGRKASELDSPNLRRRGSADFFYDEYYNSDRDKILFFMERLFKPWEIEEIGCVADYVHSQYDCVFRDICWDVNEFNPKWETSLQAGYKADLSHDNALRRRYITGVAAHGLGTLLRALRPGATKQSIVSEVIPKITPSPIFLREAFSQKAQEGRRARRNGTNLDRDRRQLRREALAFVGDDLRWRDDPPWAWTKLWSSTYSNLYGEYIPDQLRAIGYVMWDEKRMWDSDGTWLITTIAKKAWKNDFPRNNVDNEMRRRFRAPQSAISDDDSEDERHSIESDPGNAGAGEQGSAVGPSNAAGPVQDADEPSEPPQDSVSLPLHDYDENESRPSASAPPSVHDDEDDAADDADDAAGFDGDDIEHQSFHDVAIGEDGGDENAGNDQYAGIDKGKGKYTEVENDDQADDEGDDEDKVENEGDDEEET